MLTHETARKLALALPDVEEKPHFERSSFRVKGKIFLTLHPGGKPAMVKLSAADQSVFSLSKVYWPVPGFWGRQGATFVDLKKVSKSMFLDSLHQAWITVAPKKLRAAHPEIGHSG